jgi:hypothetical protein
MAASWTSTGELCCTRPCADLRPQRADQRACRPEDQPEFLKQVVGPMTPARRKKFEAGWPLHRGFGASCDPVVFHLPGVWRVRQNEKLYKVTSTLTGEPRLWVDINRSIQKLPGQGNNEFLHFDYNPFALAKQKEQDNAAKAPRAVCGKICYTRSRFVCVPGTHTRSFLEEFVEKYAELYPHVKQSDKKVALDKGKADPLNLIARQKYYEIPPGCGIFWDDKLLHGQIKTPLDANAEYGAYIGMFPAGSRPGYRKVCRVDELDDRLRSYHEGCAPKLWPSLDEIRFYPKKFDNFPQLMEAYLNKLPPDHPMITTRTTKLGKQVCLPLHPVRACKLPRTYARSDGTGAMPSAAAQPQLQTTRAHRARKASSGAAGLARGRC